MVTSTVWYQRDEVETLSFPLFLLSTKSKKLDQIYWHLHLRPSLLHEEGYTSLGLYMTNLCLGTKVYLSAYTNRVSWHMVRDVSLT